MTKRNIGDGSKDDLISSYNELVEITNGIRESAYGIIASNAGVIKELPSIINKLDEKNVDKEDVDKVISIAKTIASDTDKYMDELKDIDNTYVGVNDKPVKSAKKANKNYVPVLAVGSRYQDITSRISETTGSLVGDFSILCEDLLGLNEETDTPSEETVNE